MCCRGILDRFRALSLSSEDICAGQLRLIRPAAFGMSEVENACQSYEDIPIKF